MTPKPVLPLPGQGGRDSNHVPKPVRPVYRRRSRNDLEEICSSGLATPVDEEQFVPGFQIGPTKYISMICRPISTSKTW